MLQQEGQRTTTDWHQQIRRICGIFFCKKARGSGLVCFAGKSSKLKKLDEHLDVLNAPFLQSIFERLKGSHPRRLRHGQAFEQQYAPRLFIRARGPPSS
jgi:hypothetical protein